MTCVCCETIDSCTVGEYFDDFFQLHAELATFSWFDSIAEAKGYPLVIFEDLGETARSNLGDDQYQATHLVRFDFRGSKGEVVRGGNYLREEVVCASFCSEAEGKICRIIPAGQRIFKLEAGVWSNQRTFQLVRVGT